MKKIIIFSMIMGAALAAKAEDGPVATLIHEGEITTFTGYKAFHQANEYASDGDIIHLSAGTFEAPGNFLKTGLTVIGAGMGTGTENEENVTYVDNEIMIVPYSDLLFHLEGLCLNYGIIIHAGQGYFQPRSVTISKCSIPNLNIGNNNVEDTKVTISDCKIEYCIATESLAALTNCVIGHLSTSGASFANCVIYDFYIADHGWKRKKMSADTIYDNCIFLNTTANGGAEELNMSEHYINNTFYNCLAVGAFDEIYAAPQYAEGCWTVASAADVFDQYTSSYSTIVALTLNAEAQSAYKGTDGKQVGIYGGLKPFTNVAYGYPSVNINVDRNTTPAGNLNISASIE